MGDQNSVLTADDARHLLRRAGFGGPPIRWNVYTNRTRGEAADLLLRFRSVKLKAPGRDIYQMRNWWFRYMQFTGLPMQEKMVLFWHDHFATGYDKVQNHTLMGEQQGTFRLYGKGNFKAFVKAINLDPAMMDYLDTIRNRKTQPNENYARELMELFTLGVKDLTPAAADNYTQEDITQIARAFTGWTFNSTTLERTLLTSRHDFQYPPSYTGPDRGPKVVFKGRPEFPPGPGLPDGGLSFAANSSEEGASEIDRVIDIIFQHRDSEGKSTVARYITHKLFTYFCHATPSLAVIDELIATSNFDGSTDPATAWELKPLLRAILCHDEFYATAAPAPFDANTKKSVKWPIHYVIEALRLTGVRPDGRYYYIHGGSGTNVHDALDNMGQLLFEPPSVFGWDWELGWLSSSTMLARYNFARDITAARERGAYGFHPEYIRVNRTTKLIDLTDPAAIRDGVTDYLGITNQLTDADKAALLAYLQDDGNGPPGYTSLDLYDEYIRNTKLHGLFGMLLQSPAFQLY
jgi:uncharacterized protein (DUF1800 family)